MPCRACPKEEDEVRATHERAAGSEELETQRSKKVAADLKEALHEETFGSKDEHLLALQPCGFIDESESVRS